MTKSDKLKVTNFQIMNALHGKLRHYSDMKQMAAPSKFCVESASKLQKFFLHI